MAKEQGLKTLGDYRRIAKQTLFTPLLPIYGKTIPQSTSIYDAVSVALRNIYVLIAESQMNKPEVEQWGTLWFPGTKYEMNNEPLFRCVKLMELAIYCKNQKTRDKAFQGWLERPDKDIGVFTSVGFSYLEAALDYVEERGRDVIYSLQNAYILHLNRKGVSGVFTEPMKFLSKTPEIDKLQIWHEPDPIIKVWYNRILAALRKGFPSSEYTSSILEKEFKTIYLQLEYEFDVWKNGKTGNDVEYSLPLFMKQWAVIFGISRNKMSELRDSERYHFRQVSDRKWSLPKNELPAEYLEKYRNHPTRKIPQKQ